MSDKPKIDLNTLEHNLKSVIARNSRILAIMKIIESSDIPAGETALSMLAAEINRQMLTGALDETAE